MTDNRTTFFEQTGTLAPLLAQAYLDAMAEVRDGAPIGLLTEAIEAGDWFRVFELLQMGSHIILLEEPLPQIQREGGQLITSSIPSFVRAPAGTRLSVRFQGTHPEAQALVREQGARLVSRITDDQRRMLQEVISESVGQRHSRAIALDIAGRIDRTSNSRRGGLVGLTARDAATVRRYRDALRTGDTARLRAYLQLESRDRRFDASVLRAIRDGKGMDQTRANRLMGRMSDRMLRRRAETIAQTETIAALNGGRQRAVSQMIENGDVAARHVTRTWSDTGDGRTRPMHRRMNETSVPWGAPYTAPDGSLLMHPGDSSLGASGEMTINCRCYEKIRIDWIAAQRERNALAA